MRLLALALALPALALLVMPQVALAQAPKPADAEAAHPAPTDSSPVPAPSDLPAPAPEAKPEKAPSQAEATEKTFESHRDQGIHYFRDGRLKPAKLELITAAKMKGGANDYALHLYLARVQHQLYRIEQAHLEAQRAMELGRTPEEKAAAKAELDGLRSFYGEVTFLSAGPESGPRRGYLVLQSTTAFIAPEKKRAWARVRDDFLKSPTTLPLSAYLPGGEFTANGIPFSVIEGDTAEVFLGLRTSPEAGSFPWMWVAGGTVAAAAGLVAVWALTPEPVPKKSLRIEGTF